MQRVIEGFHLDRFQEWVAELECGHELQMKHNPPYMECRWIGTGKGRQEHIGDSVECVDCDMPKIPDGMTLVETSPVYQRSDMPSEWQGGFSTEPGVWARVVVKEGMLRFVIEPGVPASRGFLLDKGFAGVMAPDLTHSLSPAMGDVQFYIEYYSA